MLHNWQKKRGGGLSQFGQCLYLDCFFNVFFNGFPKFRHPKRHTIQKFIKIEKKKKKFESLNEHTFFVFSKNLNLKSKNYIFYIIFLFKGRVYILSFISMAAKISVLH